MRQNISSSRNRVVAKKVSIGRRSVVMVTDKERIEIPVPDGIPEELNLPPAGTVLQDVSVSLNASGDVIYGMHPTKGTHIVRFQRFAAPPNEEPKPKFKQAEPPSGKRTWWTKDRYTFTALLEIVAGDFVGFIVPWTMDYIFKRDSDGTAYLEGTKTQVARMIKFMELCGFDVANEVLQYSDNLLPDLGMLLSDQDAVFQVTMKNGFVDEAADLPAGLDLSRLKKARKDDPYFDEDDEEEDEPRHRKETRRIMSELYADEKPTTRNLRPEPDLDEDDEDWDEDEEEEVKPKTRRSRSDVF